MNSIDGDMAGVVSTQTEELVRLKREQEHTGIYEQEGNISSNHANTEANTKLVAIKILKSCFFALIYSEFLIVD